MDHKNLQLPSTLALARRRSKLSQKALALASAMDQSYVCGVERGRRPTPKPEAIDRLITALGLTESASQSDQLRWAAAHDRVLQAAAANDLVDAIPLVAAALAAARLLEPSETAGLLSTINRAIDSRQHLQTLAAASASSSRMEAHM